jgi:mRNA interferase MazF
MKKLMPTYDPYSVIVVPFPFTDIKKSKKRPALVISSQHYQQYNGHITVAMITSSRQTQWHGDHTIIDLAQTGLHVDSIVRQKIFTIDIRLVQKKIGKLSAQDKKKVNDTIKQHLC